MPARQGSNLEGRVAHGYEAEALDVAHLPGLGASAVERSSPRVPEPNGGEVLVVVGSDLA